MNGPYDDILHLPHHVSTLRRQMSLTDRAAQFSPFAALTGHDAAIRETARITDSEILPDVDAISLLDERLRILAAHASEHPQITAEYFVPDPRKDGGTYLHITGTVRRVLPQQQCILLTDNRTLFFDRILRLSGPLF